MPTAPLPIPPGFANNFGRVNSDGTIHAGLDIPPGNPPRFDVVSPETGVVAAVWTNDSTPRFQGYGPAGVVIKGDSGFFHLLAHMQAWSVAPTVGQRFDEGEQVGIIAVGLTPSRFWKSPHVHWEVRRVLHGNQTSLPNEANLNPVLWLQGKFEPLVLTNWLFWLAVGVAVHFASKRRR